MPPAALGNPDGASKGNPGPGDSDGTPPVEHTRGGPAASTTLRRLFAPWPAVAVEDADLPAEAPFGPPAEWTQVAQAASRRQIEFATVRLCARRAAARLGSPPFVLRNDEHRAPIWPATLVGALTHTGKAPGGYCAAAVALAQDVLTVGLDAEQADPLPLRLWRFVLTPTEQIWLNGLVLHSGGDGDGKGLAAKILFSAKECFYKAQYPLTHRRLGFHDVEISLDFANQAFEVHPLASAATQELSSVSWTGRFNADGALVRTALAVER